MDSGESLKRISITVVLSFQALAWVRVYRPNKAWSSLKFACFGLEYFEHVDEFCGKKTIVFMYYKKTIISTLGRKLGTGFL